MPALSHELNRDLNLVVLIGQVGTDPRIRYTPQGAPVATFRLAVNSGGRTDWFTVTAWGHLGTWAMQYLAKGRRIYVEGPWRTRRLKSGEKRGELVATEIVLL